MRRSTSRAWVHSSANSSCAFVPVVRYGRRGPGQSARRGHTSHPKPSSATLLLCWGLLLRSGAVADSVTAPPVVCLNMVVRNAAHMRDDGHLLRDTLDSVAPYISSWVIVDAGSTDGTQDLITHHMASLGIPGELY